MVTNLVTLLAILGRFDEQDPAVKPSQMSVNWLRCYERRRDQNILAGTDEILDAFLIRLGQYVERERESGRRSKLLNAMLHSCFWSFLICSARCTVKSASAPPIREISRVNGRLAARRQRSSSTNSATSSAGDSFISFIAARHSAGSELDSVTAMTTRRLLSVFVIFLCLIAARMGCEYEALEKPGCGRHVPLGRAYIRHALYDIVLWRQVSA